MVRQECLRKEFSLSFSLTGPLLLGRDILLVPVQWNMNESLVCYFEKGKTCVQLLILSSPSMETEEAPWCTCSSAIHLCPWMTVGQRPLQHEWKYTLIVLSHWCFVPICLLFFFFWLCWDLVSWPGLELCSPQQKQSLNHWTFREVPLWSFVLNRNQYTWYVKTWANL